MDDLLAREGLRDNLRFLVVEVGQQLERTVQFLHSPASADVGELLARDDYIDQLKKTIGRRCFALEVSAEASDSDRKLLRALDATATNLERIADFCENIVGHASYVARGVLAGELQFDQLAAKVSDGLAMIEPAIENADVKTALAICKLERDLDHLYESVLRRMMRAMSSGEHTKRRLATIFIAHYFERMGDSLENIGEAIISWLLGDRLKVQQVSALGNLLPKDSLSQGDIELQEVGETRSGCHISRVTEPSGRRLAIFKEGKLRKLASEKESVDEWERLVPGLVAKIYSFHVHEDTGAILYEYLEGTTFQQILLGGSGSEVAEATQAVADALQTIWQTTRSDGPARPRFVGQLRSRLPAVYAVHPEFRGESQSIGSKRHLSFDELIDVLEPLDDELSPFSVRIHGDFNVDNIIYRSEEKLVRLIDVHRSREMDFVQDITVLLVSGQRLRRLDEPIRRRINSVGVAFFEFARDYADAGGDQSFELRFALGLARSLATSTRFILDKELASSMFLRARFILEDVARRGLDEPRTYRLPREALVD